MTPLQKSLTDYLALRRALGFKLVREGMWLPTLVQSIERSGSVYITGKTAISWARGKKKPPAPSWVKRLSMARKFALYLHGRDPRHEVPPRSDHEFVRPNRLDPYIYTDTDVLSLMREAKKIRSPFKGETLSTMIGLLASTGMRVGEVIRLQREDFDPKKKLLQIRHSKWGKSVSDPLSTVPAASLYSCEGAGTRYPRVFEPWVAPR